MLPRFAENQDAVRDAREQADNVRGTTADERMQILVELCDMAAELVSQQPNPQATLRYQDPVSAETQELFERLRSANR